MALRALGSSGPVKPVELYLQTAYYLFLFGDAGAAAHLLQMGKAEHGANPQVLLNLAVCQSRSRQFAQATETGQAFLAIEPDNAVVHDVLSRSLHELGRHAEAAATGTRALELKDAQCGAVAGDWRLPQGTPQEWLAARGKHDVIAFSLWGAAPRYLRGAIDNALAAPQVYPGWKLRFHVDDSVPAEVRNALVELGCEIRDEPSGQPARDRLAWRFKVSDDPGVGRFLVRDADSVLNPREAAAVAQWVASGRWFHVMRDWWTHTDPMLAGMWGGVAGALPALEPMLAVYNPQSMETPNIDQWFLREEVWRYVRLNCVVHDRCFTPAGSQPWPVPAPPGGVHVGQDEFAARRQAQEQRLGRWLESLPSLRLPSRP